MKTNCLLFFLFLILFVEVKGQTAMYATAGSGNMRNYISWFNWAGTTIANNNSYNFTTEDGLVVTISFSNVSGPAVTPYVMNTWSGAVLWKLYDFTDPAIKPALFSQSTSSQVTFKMNISATRGGVPAPFTFIAADAEGSDQTETTILTTSGIPWRTIELFRNSTQTSNPAAGCGSTIVNLSLTYGGAPQTGQNPILATGSTGNMSLTTQMIRNSPGGMAIAFGIFSPIDRGDLPNSYGFANHSIRFSTNNSCNFNPPLPSISQDQSLRLGMVPGDPDGAQTLNDNASGADEDAISSFPFYNGSGSYSLNVPLNNSTGADAYLTGWFDFNRNGSFDNGESVSVTVPNGSSSASLTWTGIPLSFPAGTQIDFAFRFRLASDPAESTPASGYAKDGEVEDYLVSKHFLMSTAAAFAVADTVCTNLPVNVTNTSSGGSTFFWNFCSPDITATPSAVNLGNPGFTLHGPGYTDYVKENGNYFAFVTNNIPGTIVRLNFGNSLLNTPVATTIGSLTGTFPAIIKGIQAVKDNDQWFLLIVGTDQFSLQPKLIKIELGTDITNISPVLTDWGNIGGLNDPSDLEIVEENGLWYGFTVNTATYTITRFDFGNSLAQAPAGTNLGNLGNLNNPRGLDLVKESGNWILFIANAGNSTLSRVDFGNSILFAPTGTNLGNPGGMLHNSSDILIMPYCDDGAAYVTNRDPAFNDVVQLRFGSSLLNNPTASSMGNIGNLSAPNSFSRLMRFGSDLFTFIANPVNNTITRFRFSGCNNATIPSSSLENPPVFSYNAPGIYNVQLLVDEGLPSQAAFCKKIVVLAPPIVNAGTDTSICAGESILLHANAGNATSISWSPATGLSATDIDDPVANPSVNTQYIITVSNSHCTVKDTINVTVKSLPQINLGNDTTMCKADSIQFNAGNPGGTYSWQNGDQTQSFNALDSGWYSVSVNVNGCLAADTVHVAFKPDPVFSVRSDTAICHGTSLILSTQSQGNYSYQWSPATGLSSSTDPTPIATIDQFVRYYVIATNSEGCTLKDSVALSDIPLPVVEIGQDALICPGQSITLDAGNPGASFLWSDGITTQTNAIAASGNYSVVVTDNNGCSASDSIVISDKPFPVFTISPDAPSICETDSVLIRASGGTTYEWYTTVGSLNVTDSFITAYPTVATQYFVAITDNVCNYSDTLMSGITVRPAPQIFITKENDINCLQPSARLSASGGIDYQWIPLINITDANSATPTVSPQTDTWYHVKASGANGCIAEDSILVSTHFDGVSNFYVPSAFTPNGDGKNDCFGVSYWGPAQEFEMDIYNRWGERVYRSNDPSGCWNGYFKGQLQPNGVFVYYIRVKGSCGTAFKKGTVTLLH